jgi:hypothetical protein
MQAARQISIGMFSLMYCSIKFMVLSMLRYVKHGDQGTLWRTQGNTARRKSRVPMASSNPEIVESRLGLTTRLTFS